MGKPNKILNKILNKRKATVKKHTKKKKTRRKLKRGGNKSKCEIFVIDHNNFAEYQKMLEGLQMCDTDYISPNLEEMTYDVLEYEGNMGFFCRDPISNKISSVLCVDLNSNENLPPSVMNNLSNSNATSTAEIMLLCSSKTNRVPGATRDLFDKVMKYLASIKKQHIYLRVAKPSTNKRAIDFYQSLGFTMLKENGLMMLTLS
jgi:hypothetical protein